MSVGPYSPLDRSALKHCRFDDITFDDDRNVGRSHMQQMVGGVTSSAAFEKRYVTRSGRILWASVSTALVRGPYGHPGHFVTYIQDITERIRAEKLLRESEDRYHQLFELSPDPVAVHSAGKIVLVNAAALRAFGATGPEDVIGMPVMGFVDPQFHNVVQMRISKEISGHETVPTLEERFIRLDGRPIDVEVTAAPISHGGKPASLVVFRDIQERKKAERLQRALFEISRAANEADTLDELFAAVHRIISSVMAATNFYIALRDSREEKITFPYFVDEVDEYLHSVTAGLVRSFYRHGITCHVDAEKVHLDLDRAIPCGLIINELVSNALKHAFPHGKTGNIVVSLRALADETVELAVQDDGVGFPDGKPFDRMTTMGMTLVNSLAHQILGSMTLDRSSGTRFVLKFKRTT